MRSTQKVDDHDATLISGTARGDERSFEELVVKHQHSVLNLIYRYVGDRDEAEDIAQDVFIKVWRNAKHFKGKSRFATWLYRIVVNQCLNHRGKRKRNPVSLDETLENDRLPDGLKVDMDLERRERARILKSALHELPKNQRMALVLANYEGRSYREVSDIMGLSLSSVTSLVFRAKEGLRKRLLPLRVNGEI